METCVTCNLHYKRSEKHNYDLTKRHMAVTNQKNCRHINKK